MSKTPEAVAERAAVVAYLLRKSKVCMDIGDARRSESINAGSLLSAERLMTAAITYAHKAHSLKAAAIGIECGDHWT